MTHDIDLVIELSDEDAQRFVDAFPIETFYWDHGFTCGDPSEDSVFRAKRARDE